MTKEMSSERPFVKSVNEFYQRINVLQKLTLGLVVSNAILLLILGISLQRNPIVILERDAEKLSFIGDQKEVVITDKEIKKAVEKYIRLRYEWEKFDSNETIDKLTPVITSGLKDKVLNEITAQKESYKAISQYVGSIKVTVDENGNIVGVFDRILRITGKLKDGLNLPGLNEKIPLLSEAQIMVKVVKGTMTQENPLGIYINSVINYETN
jgi:hypothetical protein